METKKVLTIVFSILFFGAFVFVLCWGIINFNKVQQAMNGTEIYNSSDLDNAYNDGYNTALKNKEEYDNLINGYRDEITTLNDTISQLNGDKTILQNNIRDYQTQVNNLNGIVSQNEDTINNLDITVAGNNDTISTLNTQISGLNAQIADIEDENNIYKNTIESKTTMITSLQSQVSSLQSDSVNYNQTINSLNSQISSLQAQINTLNITKINYENEIADLNNQIGSLNNQKTHLESLISDNNVSINSLNTQISTLRNDVNNLNVEINNKNNQINILNNQISSLQTSISQLQTTNELHLSTISSLNTQITNLNSQVSDLTLQIQNNGNSVSSLNTRISTLENSVRYYENYIAGLESADTAVATFEFDGSVYNIQIVNKNSVITVTEPASTDYKLFNGWMVNNENVDLTTYQITENTKFIANITYKYDVNFVVDGETINSQLLNKGNFPVIPNEPSKSGYAFDGWMVNNTITDIATLPINENMTFVAKFTKLHNVSFVYENSTISTQSIRNGEYAFAPNVENTTYITFNGWKLNNSRVNIESQAITSDTTFVADLTYSYDVNYVVDDNAIYSQVVRSNQFATQPENPVKEGYEFDGWTLNGNEVNPQTISIIGTTNFVAKFTKLYNATFVNGSESSTQIIRDGNFATPLNVESTEYSIFNGWLVNNTIVNVLTYPITHDTTFVASITTKYNVNFIVDGNNHNTQIVENNRFASIPAIPTKEGYVFGGWLINGSPVIVSQYAITNETTFVATFNKVWAVVFTYEGSNISTQSIINGGHASVPSIANTNYKVFNGWKLNDMIVDATNQVINANTFFVADITYKYEVVFMVGENVVDTQLIPNDNYANLPEEPVKEASTFDGWSIDGQNVVDVSSYLINEHTTFIAKFTCELYNILSLNIFDTKTNIKQREYLVATSNSESAGTYYIDYKNGIAIKIYDSCFTHFETTDSGRIFLTGFTNGIMQYNPEDRTISQVYSNGSAYSFTVKSGKYLCYCTSSQNLSSIVLYNDETNEFIDIYTPEVVSYMNINLDENGDIIIINRTEYKVLKYVINNNILNQYGYAEGYQIPILLNNGDILISSYSNTGIYYYNHLDNTITKKYGPGYSWSSYIELDDGNYLLAVHTGSYPSSLSAGVVYVDITEKSITPLYTSGTNWLDNKIVLSNGGILMSADNDYNTSCLGALYYNPETKTIKRIVSSGLNYYFKELKSNDVILISRSNKYKGLHVYSTDTNQLITLSNSLYSNLEYAEFDNNTCLITGGFYSTGIYFYDANNNTAKSISLPTSIIGAWSIDETHGMAMIGASMYLFDTTTGSYTLRSSYDSTAWYFSIKLPNGNILLSNEWNSNPGLLVYNPTEDTFTKIYDTGYYYNTMILSKDNKVILASAYENVSGILIYDLTTNTIEKCFDDGFYLDEFEETEDGILLYSSKYLKFSFFYDYSLGRIVER